MYQPFSKYTVQVKLESPNGPQEDFFETKDVMRDRRNFSKHLIRSFLKNALEREPWHGAPWVVRSILAKECALPLDVPVHLQQSARIAEKKALKKLHLEQQRQAEQSMFTITDFRQHPNGRKGGLIAGPAGPPIMPQPWQSRPGNKQKTKFIHNFQLQSAGNYIGNQTDFRHYPMDPNQPHVSVNGNGLVQGFVVYPHDQPPYAQGAVFQHVTKLPTHQKDKMSLPPSPPPFKFPMEDLDVPPKETDFQRPKLKSFVELSIASLELDEECPTGRFDETSVGSLLEVWNTLNVHSEVFILDSFTFDDLAEALRFSASDVQCELLTEVHCAVLKQLVDQKGDLMVDLPRFQVSVEKESEESEEESEDEEEEQPEEDSPEPQPEPLRRTTRGSLAKAEALAISQAKSPTPEKAIIHRAAELESQSPWRERCMERDFKNNNWQSVLAGLLYQVSLKEVMKERCERLLSQLLPPDVEPSNETVIDQYATLNVNLRLDALEIIVMLAVRTKAIRDHLEKMSQEMTDLRKKKIEQQRLKKDLYGCCNHHKITC
jgi:DDT domain/WSTF, HB1, Itc1p, MBD9 motif 1